MNAADNDSSNGDKSFSESRELIEDLFRGELEAPEESSSPSRTGADPPSLSPEKGAAPKAPERESFSGQGDKDDEKAFSESRELIEDIFRSELSSFESKKNRERAQPAARGKKAAAVPQPSRPFRVPGKEKPKAAAGDGLPQSRGKPDTTRKKKKRTRTSKVGTAPPQAPGRSPLRKGVIVAGCAVVLSLLFAVVVYYSGMIHPSKKKGPGFSPEKKAVEASRPQGVIHTEAGKREAAHAPKKPAPKEVLKRVPSHKEAPAATKAQKLGEGHGEAKKAETVPNPVLSMEEKVSKYPYAILLGAFKTIARAEKAIALYRKKGISSYWVKVDLGEKGIWYRVFAGHFRDESGARAFIRKKRLSEARAKRTKYGILIGQFKNGERLQGKLTEVRNLGYSPYVITSDRGVSCLYVGAYYTKQGAEAQESELVSKGIDARVVER